ncbi:MAG: hypothetical protein JJE04_22645 [Acidobacteriia bacterium]|nr:hypothetical protein [Terriglobia bacterium]
MNEFEDQLREAMHRREPGPGFAGRVAAMATGARKPVRRSNPVWRWAMAAAAACLMMVTGVQEYRRHQGEQARRQLLLALQITSEKLSLVDRQLEKVEGIVQGIMVDERTKQ